MQFIVPEKRSFYIGEHVIQDSSNTFRPVAIHKSFTNEPVNLAHVIYMVPSELLVAGGVIKLPQIIFVTNAKDNNITWTFEKVEERNKYYEKILISYADVVKPEE